IEARAERFLAQLQAQSGSPGAYSLQAVASASGGGALPEITMPSFAVAVAIAALNPDDVSKQLRLGNPAVLSRVKDGVTLIDFRTVLPQDEEALLRRILACSSEESP